MELESLLYPLIVGFGAFGGLYKGYRAFWRKRLIENIPTSKCEGVTMGLTELSGAAQMRAPLRSYLAEKKVIYYRFTVEEQWQRTETYTDSKGNRRTRTVSGWMVVRSGEQRPRFFLRDDTGRIRIDPKRAEVDPEEVFSTTCTPLNPLYYGKGPRGAIANSTFRRRFREWGIRPNQAIYVMGTARIREDVVEPEIAYDQHSMLYLISTKSEEELVESYNLHTVVGFILAVVLGTFFAPVYQASIYEIAIGEAIQNTLPWMVLGGGSFATVIAMLYLKTIYNGLVDLRHRAHRAWSMIDVELKRRHDLIPNLVSVVGAVVEHERETLSSVVTERRLARLGATPTARAKGALDATIHAQSEALGRVFALVESYPVLKGDEAFAKLTKELTRCENKLALARTFYNDSVTNLNIRVESFPDSLFASVARAERRLLISAMEFETKPIAVSFEEEPEPELAAFLEEAKMENVEIPPGALVDDHALAHEKLT